MSIDSVPQRMTEVIWHWSRCWLRTPRDRGCDRRLWAV